MTAPMNPGSSSARSNADQRNSHAAQQASAPPRFVAGAIDLGDVKAKAQQRTGQGHAGGAAQQSPGGQPTPGVSEGASAGETVERVASVTPETFEADLVLRSTQVPVVLLLGSSTDEASAQLHTAFSRLIQAVDAPQEQLSWVFRHVNVDEQPEMAQALGVQAVPTVVALAGGRPLADFQGAQPEDQLQAWVDAVIQAVQGKLQGLPPEGDGSTEPEQDPRLSEAEDKVQAGNVDGALKILDAIPSGDPAYSQARAARAQALLIQRVDHGEASAEGHDGEEKIAAAEAEPDNAERASEAADYLILMGKKEQAFDALIRVIRNDVGDERAAAKQRLLELFDLFDAADPEVIAARTRMASALF